MDIVQSVSEYTSSLYSVYLAYTVESVEFEFNWASAVLVWLPSLVYFGGFKGVWGLYQACANQTTRLVAKPV